MRLERQAHNHERISTTISVIMTDDERPDEEREDMLSILRELRPYYFWILIAQIAVWSVVVFLSERDNCAEVGLSGCAVMMGLKVSGLVPLMLLTSVILVDVGRYFMVFLRHPREKELARARAKARAEGRAEGRTEGQARGADKMYVKWSAWNSRRIEAERRGEPFNEPPPVPDDGTKTDDKQ